MSTFRGVALENDCIHSQQVWVSGYKRYENNEITAVSINTLPGMMCIAVMSTLRGMPLKVIGYTIGRYDFQVINVIGIFK